MSNISVANTDSYKSICIQATINDDMFSNFKSMIEYQQILEHTGCHCGSLYIKYILDSKKFNSLIHKFKSNDSIGNPNKCNYVIDGIDYGSISPTTLRYIKVLCEINNLFGDMSNWDIVELGGGYGGQSKIIQDAYVIKSYQMIDLKEVENLQSKYIDYFKYKSDFEFKNKYDLFISNYAYTELCKDLQDDYLESVINKSARGYITCNFLSENYNVDSYNRKELISKFSHLNPTIIDEYPLTYDGNFIMTWSI